jgi:glutaredoxin 3
MSRTDTQLTKEDLVLYSSPLCGYCHRVQRVLAELGVEITVRNTLLDPAARQELIQHGGSTQVPMLLIQGQAMYESEDIMTFLREHFAKGV